MFASICKVVYQITKEKKEFKISAEEIYTTIAVVVPTLCLAFSFWLGKKSLKFAELHGPALFGSLTLLTIIFNILYQEELSTSFLYK